MPHDRLAANAEDLAFFYVLAIPGGKEALAGLKQRGFVLGIVTDTIYPIDWKMRWLDKVGVAEFMDVVACSTVLGAHKPDPAMYLNALQQAHLAPSESAFVGHDAGELEGARKAGIATVANQAPHPNAAKLMIRWYMGDKEGGKGFEPYHVPGDLPPRSDMVLPVDMFGWDVARETLWTLDYDWSYLNLPDMRDFWTIYLEG